jgi:hypothetical protein
MLSLYPQPELRDQNSNTIFFNKMAHQDRQQDGAPPHSPTAFPGKMTGRAVCVPPQFAATEGGPM